MTVVDRERRETNTSFCDRSRQVSSVQTISCFSMLFTLSFSFGPVWSHARRVPYSVSVAEAQMSVSAVNISTQNVNSVQQDDDRSRSNPTTKKPANRPAMQIYRPPGLRSDGTASSSGGTATNAKPKQAAGEKLLDKNHRHEKEENNNKCRSEADSTSSRTSSRASHAEERPATLIRTESSLSSESTPSQKSFGSNSNKASGQHNGTGGAERKKPQQFTRKEVKKKAMGEREIEDAIAGLRALQLTSHAQHIENWIGGAFCNEELAETIGSALCRHAIEGGGRGVAKLCALFKDSPSIQAFTKGHLIAISQYFECRDKIRTDHFRMWISFVNFLTDVYGNLGGGPDGELASIVFQVFNFLLRPPILETLKIEELESLISTLLTVGYDLERECPDQLSLLKDLIRDAFIDVSEPWARKMILLLLELGASGWKLPPEANEYYFQQTST
ncbi:unnamed protein product [Caenorhabditis auriculariae]|uniref:MIF4G domain-containing protein n=1 Tax=Caenorhabditis auriculariae TaxID=2777116 RepID=A0A8S1HET9_9PELO|nr:unnamed protein product [Caenorhabditis auriculariae]